MAQSLWFLTPYILFEPSGLSKYSIGMVSFAPTYCPEIEVNKTLFWSGHISYYCWGAPWASCAGSLMDVPLEASVAAYGALSDLYRYTHITGATLSYKHQGTRCLLLGGVPALEAVWCCKHRLKYFTDSLMSRLQNNLHFCLGVLGFCESISVDDA